MHQFVYTILLQTLFFFQAVGVFLRTFVKNIKKMPIKNGHNAKCPLLVLSTDNGQSLQLYCDLYKVSALHLSGLHEVRNELFLSGNHTLEVKATVHW